MTRTTLYKGVYFGMVGCTACAALAAIWVTKNSRLGGLIAPGIIVLLLIPGRILGYFWRDLLRGLRLLNAKSYEASKRHSEAFLKQVKAKPWLKHLIWLGSASYSRDPEALALNNLGAAEIGLGNHAEAQTHLEASIAIDAQNPLPYFNLGVLSRTLGDEAAAAYWFTEAKIADSLKISATRS